MSCLPNTRRNFSHEPGNAASKQSCWQQRASIGSWENLTCCSCYCFLHLFLTPVIILSQGCIIKCFQSAICLVVARVKKALNDVISHFFPLAVSFPGEPSHLSTLPKLFSFLVTGDNCHPRNCNCKTNYPHYAFQHRRNTSFLMLQIFKVDWRSLEETSRLEHEKMALSATDFLPGYCHHECITMLIKRAKSCLHDRDKLKLLANQHEI